MVMVREIMIPSNIMVVIVFAGVVVPPSHGEIMLFEIRNVVNWAAIGYEQSNRDVSCFDSTPKE